ncbi:polysaccharide lyase family 7 protein [Alteromonas sp. C1M14]|nr:polysaccharide lyase family 7 protein [Alteromonas sp. C1M14]MBU2977198.1 polysaccharide lyase family 7 protein [Alteromonas sp. C1M14]
MANPVLCYGKVSAEAIPSSHLELTDGVLLGNENRLISNVPPSYNFDLNDWSLSLPIDSNNDEKADLIYENVLSDSFQLTPFFYTAKDGGMVFTSPNHGAKTSKNTKYTRTELREMLRRGNVKIKTQGVTENNWVFDVADRATKQKAGAVEGSLEATLAVNHVSVSGDKSKVGRVIIGQIHATDDEPIRLYYRKLPHNRKGAVYFAHEINGGDDIWVNLVGSRRNGASNPEEGIALDEKFSYKISVVNSTLMVTLIREGKKNITRALTMHKSGYEKRDQYMYFKAGVYNQNNSGDKDDYVQATFYYLNNIHR